MIAAYRDALRLLLVFAQQRTGTQPSRLDLDDLERNLAMRSDPAWTRVPARVFPRAALEERQPWLSMDTATWRITRPSSSGFPWRWVLIGAGGALALLVVVQLVAIARRRRGAWTVSGEVLDDAHELVDAVALRPRESHELLGSCDDRAALRRPGDGDAATAPELEQPLVAKLAQRPQHGVRVDAEHGGEVARRREPLPRLRLALGDRAADLRRPLLVQIRRLCAIDLDTEHDASHSSFIRGHCHASAAHRRGARARPARGADRGGAPARAAAEVALRGRGPLRVGGRHGRVRRIQGRRRGRGPARARTSAGGCGRAGRRRERAGRRRERPAHACRRPDDRQLDPGWVPAALVPPLDARPGRRAPPARPLRRRRRLVRRGRGP